MTDNMTTLEAECILKNHGFPDQRSADAAHVLMTSHAALTERVAVLKNAIRPFADCADELDAEDREWNDEEWAKFRLLVGNYRKARAALKDTQ